MTMYDHVVTFSFSLKTDLAANELWASAGLPLMVSAALRRLADIVKNPVGEGGAECFEVVDTEELEEYDFGAVEEELLRAFGEESNCEQ